MLNGKKLFGDCGSRNKLICSFNVHGSSLWALRFKLGNLVLAALAELSVQFNTVDYKKSAVQSKKFVVKLVLHAKATEAYKIEEFPI